MAKQRKLTYYKEFQLDSIQDHEKLNDVKELVLSIEQERFESETEVVQFRKKDDTTYDVKVMYYLDRIGREFVFCYAVLFFIQSMKLLSFEFHLEESNITIKSMTDLEKMIDDLWYENNEYYRYEIEAEKIDAYIKEELQGKSKETKRTYTNTLKAFYRHLFFHERDTFPVFREEEVNRYIMYLDEKNLKASYINKIFIAVSGYSKHLDYVLNNKKIRIPKVPDQLEVKALDDETLNHINESLVVAFVQSQQNHMLKQLPNTGKQRDKMRNLVLFRVMLACGLRLSEALNLKIDDVFLEGSRKESRYVHIKRTKTQRERKIPLDKDTTHLLKEYIEFRKEQDLQIELEKEFFNQIRNRSRISPRDGMTAKELREYENLIQRLEKEEKAKEKDNLAIKRLSCEIRYMELIASEQVVRKNFKFNNTLFVSNRYRQFSVPAASRFFDQMGIVSHQLRHTAIKNLVDKNVPFNKIQAFSGHKTAQMVLRYAVPSFEEVAEEIIKHKKL